MVCSKCLPAGLHGCAGSAISVNAHSAFRSAVARAVWPPNLPITNTPALLSLMDGPWGSDPAFCVSRCRCRQLRRYLAYRPEKEGRIYRLLDHASTGSPGHGPILLLTAWALDIVVSWDSEQEGWIRAGLPPLRMVSGPVQHFRFALFQLGKTKSPPIFIKRNRFRVEHCLKCVAHINDLALLISEKETTCCCERYYQAVSAMGFHPARLNMRIPSVGHAGLLMATGTFSGNAPPSSTLPPFFRPARQS